MDEMQLRNLQEIAQVADQQKKIVKDFARTMDMSHIARQLNEFNKVVQYLQSDLYRIKEVVTRAAQIKPEVIRALQNFNEMQKIITRFNKEHYEALERSFQLINSLSVKNIFPAYLEVGFEFRRIFETAERIDVVLRRTFINFSNVGLVQSRFTNLYLSELIVSRDDVSQAEVEIESIDRLDNLLLKIHPSLVDKRKGAWQAFKSNNPDKQSQAMNSMVELLDHALSLALKEEELETYLRKKVLSDQVKSYGTKQAEWIKATRLWIGSTKDNLHSMKHSLNKRPEDIIETLLIASERILLIVLGS